MIRTLILLLLPVAAQAETLRVATYNTELSRDGPGLLLRDIQRDNPQVTAVVEVLSQTRPDIIALQGIDWDLDELALSNLAGALAKVGMDYPYQFSEQPNSGLETAFDLDGDGLTHGPRDAQGWGRFTGQGGLAVLSRYPIDLAATKTYSDLLWRELPDAILPNVDGSPFPSLQAQTVQRLSSTGHWVVPILTPEGPLSLMTFHATPPVFDGPEDRNGLRNRDEIRFWSLLLDGEFGSRPTNRFVIAGDANLDPNLGDGHKTAIQELLSNPRIQDPQPVDQQGSSTTVFWEGIGERRVDYVLPSADWTVADSGVYWPGAGQGKAARTASRHRLVWVDLSID